MVVHVPAAAYFVDGAHGPDTAWEDGQQGRMVRDPRIGHPLLRHALSAGALAAVVLLRWVLDPLLGDTLPLVTLYGAVAAAVWLSGYRVAVAACLVGYVACSLLFIEPRGRLDLDMRDVVGWSHTCSRVG
jgi:K+-sensing histidine kinase KdpD